MSSTLTGLTTPDLHLPGDERLGKIHHRDCIAGMNDLPAGSIDLAFADPPFNIGYDYDVYHDAKDYGEYLAWSREWIGAVHRVLKPNGTFWLAIGDEYAAELKLESQKLGFHIRSWVIWYYTFGVNCKFKFSRSHAHLFYFVKNPQRFTFRHTELENRIPSARLLVYGDDRGNPNGRLPDDTWILRPQDLTDSLTPDQDTWYFPRVAGTFKERAGFHGCQMPEQLLGRIIRLCSHENEIVLDPFSGSATTLAVARKLGRRYVGFDLSPDYVQRGLARLNEIRVGDRLDGAPEPTMSAPASTASRESHANQKGRRSGRSLLEKIINANDTFQDQRSQKAFVDGLLRAFLDTNQGYSVDRVIADPELDRAFETACKKTQLPGDIRLWNRFLLRLRKAGRLSGAPTLQSTDYSWEDCDSYLFASEIAWKQMLDQGFGSLDDIFCDPSTATEFDRRAAALAPGFTPLQYRWGALKLRKQSKKTQRRADVLQRRAFVQPYLETVPISAKAVRRLPEMPGVYLVVNGARSEALYAGESLNLRDRMVRQFEREPLRVFWNKHASDIAVRYFTAEPDVPLLLAYQSLCVNAARPALNLPSNSLT